MPKQAISSVAEILRASVSSGVSWGTDGSLFLTPDNLVPNQYLTDLAESGPLGWSLSGMPEEVEGYDVLVSRPGDARQASMRRQNTATIPEASAEWVAERPWVAGAKEEGSGPAALRPEVEVIPITNRGFEAGTYGWAYGWANAQKRKGMTTASDLCFFTLSENERPTFPVPEYWPGGAAYLCIYMTKKNGPRSSAALQIMVPLARLKRGGKYTLRGPWRSLGEVPKVNASGVPAGMRPVKNHHVSQVPAQFDLIEGTLRFAVQYRNGRGAGLVGPWSERFEVKGDIIRRLVDAGSAGVGTSTTTNRTNRTNTTNTVESSMQTSAPAEAVGVTGAGVTGAGVTHEAPGKNPDSPYAKAGGGYAGEEIDDEESALLGAIQTFRRDNERPDFALDAALTRRAYASVLGGEAPKTQNEETAVFIGANRDVRDFRAVIAALSPGELRRLADPKMLRIGLARELHDGAKVWCLVFSEEAYPGTPLAEAPVYADQEGSEDPNDRGEADPVCELVDAEGRTHVYAAPDTGDAGGRPAYLGTRDVSGRMDAGAEEPLYEDQVSSWRVSQGNRMTYSYSGSYQGSAAAAVFEIQGKSALVIPKVSSGAMVNITDGSLPSGVLGRAYSDGRMILNAARYPSMTDNERKHNLVHEFLHLAGVAHTEDPSISSVMQPNMTRGGDPSSPTAYDVETLVSIYGPYDPGSTGGTGGTGGTDTGGGTTPTEEPSEPRYEIVELGVKRKTGIHCAVPKAVKKRGYRYTYWLEHTPLEGGQPKTYRARPKSARDVSRYFTGRAPFKKGFEIYGYPPESEPSRLPVALVPEELPTVDESVVEAPDPELIPDAPERDGQATLPPGKYLVALQERYEGSSGSGGGLSRASLPVAVTIASGQMFVVRPRRTVNILPNANFSQTDSKGYPSSWTPVNITNVATNTATVAENGVLRLEAAVTTASAPTLDSKRMAVSPEDTLTAGGVVASERLTDGSAVVQLLEYDTAGALIANRVIHRVSGLFAVPFSARFTPENRNPECASVALRLQMALGTSGANGRAAFSYLRVLPVASDLRQVVFGEGGEGDSFDAPPEVPFSPRSFLAAAPAPTVQGGETGEAETPEIVLSMEGALPSGTHEQNVNSATGGFVSTTPIHGTHSHRSQDASNTVSRHRYIEYDLASGGRSARSQVASRALYRFAQLPSMGSGAGAVVLHQARYAGGHISYLKAYQNGRISLVVQSTRGETEHTLSYGLTAGRLVDVEVIVRTGSQGSVTVALGYDGKARSIVFSGSFDLSGRNVRYLRFGTSAAFDAKVTYDLYTDQAVVTEGGDIPSRERPQVPPDYTPPPPDAPVLRPSSGGLDPAYRLNAPERPSAAGGTEVMDEGISQLYIHIRKEDASAENPVILDLLEDEQAVKPGLSYTAALFRRFSVFSDEAPAPGLRVVLEGEPGRKVEPITLSAPGGGASGNLGQMAGERGWHPSGTESPTEDEYLTFAVPEMSYTADGLPDMDTAYTRVRFELVLTPGVYVFQEPLFSEGLFTTFASREAKRGYGRATSGEASFVFDALPPAHELSVPRTPVYMSQYGVKVEESDSLPVGVEVASYFSRSDTGAFTLESPDPEELSTGPIVPGRYLRARVVFSGDGERTPEIASGGVFLTTWHPDAVLTREDGTHFPGVVFADMTLFETDYPDIDADSANGRLLAVRETDSVGRIREIGLTATTERAIRELENLSLQEPLILELPGAGGHTAGRLYTVRLREQVEFAPEDIETRVVEVDAGFAPFGSGRTVSERRMFARATVSEAEILARSDLLSPFELPVGTHSGSRRIA